MKEFRTGTIIRLHNLESFEKIQIGTKFFNYTRDISTPEYELIDKKFYLLLIDDDEPNHDKDNPDYVFNKIEISPEDWFKSEYDAHNKYDIEDAYCGDRWYSTFVIESTIKNLSTGETFINNEYDRLCDVFENDDLAEWSSLDNNEAFELADWYFKKLY